MDESLHVGSEMRDKAASGDVTRRSALKVGGATVGAGTLSALLAACGKGGSTSAGATTSHGGGWAKGVSIQFFGGGAPGDQFSRVVVNGALQASKDLGCSTTVIYSNWDDAKFISQLRAAIAQNPTGIAMMGHPGDAAIMPLAAQAHSKGILMDYMNTDVPKVRARYGGSYVGAAVYPEGFQLGQKAIQEFGLKSGDQAIVFGFFTTPGLAPRDNGIADAFSKGGLKVVKLVLPLSTGADPQADTSLVSGALAKYPSTKVMSLSGGQWVGAAGTYLKAAGMSPGKVKVIGFDALPGVAAAMQGGWAQMVASQEPFLQGYLPVLSLALQKKFALSPISYDTANGNYVTAQEIPTVKKLIAQGVFG